MEAKAKTFDKKFRCTDGGCNKHVCCFVCTEEDKTNCGCCAIKYGDITSAEDAYNHCTYAEKEDPRKKKDK